MIQEIYIFGSFSTAEYYYSVAPQLLLPVNNGLIYASFLSKGLPKASIEKGRCIGKGCA